MTKNVRIENADASNHCDVILAVYRRGRNGEPDVLDREEKLTFPTAQVNIGIHDGVYVVISERPKPQAAVASS